MIYLLVFTVSAKVTNMQFFNIILVVLAIGAWRATGQTTTPPPTMTTSLTIDAAVVPKGGWAHMVCNVPSNLQGLVIWSKTTNSSTGLVTVKLATNVMLESVYKPISRYVLSIQPPANPSQPLAFHFNITSTLPEDSGTYSCSINSLNGTFSNVSLIVVKDLIEPTVTVTSKTTNEMYTLADGDTIPLEENTKYDLVCSISKTNPAPLLQFTGEAQIHRTSASTINQTTYTNTAYLGLVVPSTSVVRTLTDAWIDVFGGTKLFSCNVTINPFYAAAMKVQPQTAITKFYAKFNEFKPVVNCSANVPAIVGNPLSVRCNVTASADNKPTFSWLLPDKRNMTDGSVLDGGAYSSDVTWNSDLNQYIMTLHIKSVTQENIVSGYSFSATNSKQQTTTATVTLVKGTTDKPGSVVGGSAAPLKVLGVASTALVLLLTAILSLL